MADMSNVFMFSGQGSHYYQMGRALFDAHAGFRSRLQSLDAIAAPLVGRSLIDCLYNSGYSKADTFDRTVLTSPSIFMIEYALAQTLMEDGVQPDYVLGASLGTFAAACVAGSMTVEQTLPLIVKHARTFESRCPHGSMVAILASPDLYRTEPALHDNAEMAGVNFASHFVISAAGDHLTRVLAYLKENGHTYQPISVSQAFHSRWMDDARGPCLDELTAVTIRAANIPVVCCARRGIVDTITAETLWAAMRDPIQFADTIEGLEARGPHRYIDVGPAGTLATAVKYNLRPGSASSTAGILTPFGKDVDNYRKLVSADVSQLA